MSDVGGRSQRPGKVRLLNVWVDDITLAELVEKLSDGAVYTVNLDHLYLLQRDAAFRAAYASAEVVTADSTFVFWALRWLGRPVREKVCGSDLVPAFCQARRNDPATKVFLLGAGPGVAALASERINARAGCGVVVGSHSPSMRITEDEREIDAVVELVNRSGATVLVVGFGAPKQEIWIHRHRHRMPGVRVFMGVGATLDYEAGVVGRAPRWMGRVGLEWLHRVATDPKRYGKRYIRDAAFFWWLFLDAIGRYRAPGSASVDVPHGSGR